MWDWVLGSKLLRDLRRISKLIHTIYEDVYIKLLNKIISNWLINKAQLGLKILKFLIKLNMSDMVK